MLQNTRKRVKEAQEAAASKNAAMVDDEFADLNARLQAKKSKGVPGKGSTSKKVTKSPKKNAKKHQCSPTKGTSASFEVEGPGKTRAIKQVNARFTEEDNRVDFYIEAPEDAFCSEREISESDSESDENPSPQESLSQSSQESRERRSQSTQRSRSRRTKSRFRSHSLGREQYRESRSRSLTPTKSKKRKERKQSFRRTVDQRLDSLTSALVAVQQLLVKDQPAGGKNSSKINKNLPVQVGNIVVEGESETTIYRNAVDPIVVSKRSQVTEGLQFGIDKLDLNKHISSSSEEGAIDTSDELVDGQLIGEFVADSDERNMQGGQEVRCDAPGPSDAHMVVKRSHQLVNEGVEMSRGEQMIRDAEASKAHVVATSGELALQPRFNSYLHSAFVDEQYLAMESHVEDSLRKKIENNEYIDFARLLPRDCISLDEDQRMELINRNGMSFWSPVMDREN